MISQKPLKHNAFLCVNLTKDINLYRIWIRFLLFRPLLLTDPIPKEDY